MSDKIARVCDECGKVDVLSWHAESNGMVMFSGTQPAHLLLMVDVEAGRPSRPCFPLEGKSWCPGCLIKALGEWLLPVCPKCGGTGRMSYRSEKHPERGIPPLEDLPCSSCEGTGRS